MAVESVRKISVKISTKDNRKSRTEIYLVALTAASATSTDEAAGASGLPAYESNHPIDNWLTVSSIDVEPVSDSLRHFRVTVEYTDPFTASESPTTSPLDEPIKVSYGATGGSEEYFLDRSASPKRVINSAGDPYESNPTRDADEITINVTRNVAYARLELYDLVKNSTNSTTVTIDGFAYDIDKLKVKFLGATPQTGSYINESGVTVYIDYYQESWQFMYRSAGWKDKFPDIGFNELVSGKPQQIMSAGVAVKKPWPLNGSGIKKTNVTDTPADLEFQPYYSRNAALIFA